MAHCGGTAVLRLIFGSTDEETLIKWMSEIGSTRFFSTQRGLFLHDDAGVKRENGEPPAVYSPI